MSIEPSTASAHRGVRAGARTLYRLLLVVLPATIRERHGEAMLQLFERELARSASGSVLVVVRTALAGSGDLLARGVVERVSAEQRAFDHTQVNALIQTVRVFAIACAVMTALMVWNFVSRQSHPAPGGQPFGLAWYAAPFTMAMTIPMALFVAVLWAARRRSAGRDRSSVRLAPQLLLAACVSVLCFALNAEVVPRSNAQLVSIMTGKPNTPAGDRTMTLTTLMRSSALLERSVEKAPDSFAVATARQQLANYGVEIHKKFALAAASVLLVLLALALAQWLPPVANGIGVAMVAVTSVTVFAGYYALITGGERMADHAVVWPALAMWSGNIVAFLLAATLLRLRSVNRSPAESGPR